MTSPAAGQDQAGAEKTVFAWAKINLGLKILGRRPDGYHEICSIAQTVDLADLLHIRQASETQLTCDDQQLSTGTDNLVMQALELFAAEYGRPISPLHLHLEKRIPMGAGLGGGSADAAALLRTLNGMHGKPFSGAELCGMGARLGSDVPFQLMGGTALLRGRGEQLELLESKGDPTYLLLFPGFHISSAWAYGKIEEPLTLGSSYLNFLASLGGGCVDLQALCRCLENDFQPLVERTYPIVAELLSELENAGALTCSMSGSGSTIFGVFDDRNAASQALQRVKTSGYRSFLCRPIGSLSDE